MKTKKVKARVTKPKVVKANKARDLPYTASIKVLGTVYTSTGSTVREAIENLKVGSVAKGMSILDITKGSQTQSKILPNTQTARLFSPSKLVREISLKQISMRFNF